MKERIQRELFKHQLDDSAWVWFDDKKRCSFTLECLVTGGYIEMQDRMPKIKGLDYPDVDHYDVLRAFTIKRTEDSEEVKFIPVGSWFTVTRKRDRDTNQVVYNFEYGQEDSDYDTYVDDLWDDPYDYTDELQDKMTKDLYKK